MPGVGIPWAVRFQVACPEHRSSSQCNQWLWRTCSEMSFGNAHLTPGVIQHCNGGFWEFLCLWCSWNCVGMHWVFSSFVFGIFWTERVCCLSSILYVHRRRSSDTCIRWNIHGECCLGSLTGGMLVELSFLILRNSFRIGVFFVDWTTAKRDLRLRLPPWDCQNAFVIQLSTCSIFFVWFYYRW